MKWKRAYWYSLCLECFAKYHKQGGYCAVDRIGEYRCSVCKHPKAVAEFFPVLSRPIKKRSRPR